MPDALSIFPEEPKQPPIPSSAPVTLFPEDDLETRLRQSVADGLKKPPDTATRVMRMQTRTGLPQPFIESNLDDIETEAAKRDFNAEEFRKSSPLLAKWIAENPNHYAIAKEDVSGLSMLEQAWKGLRSGWERAAVQPEEINLLMKQMNEGKLSEQEDARLKEIEARSKVLSRAESEYGTIPWTASSIGYSAKQGIVSTTQTLLGTGAGGIAGFLLTPPGVPRAAGAQAGMIAGSAIANTMYSANMETAYAWRELRDLTDEGGKPLDPQIAATAAKAVGAINGLIETGSTAMLMLLVPGMKNLVSGLSPEAAKALVRERMGRVLANQTWRNAMVQALGKMTAGSAIEGLEEFVQNLVNAGGREVAQAVSGQEFKPDSLMQDLKESSAQALPAFVGTFFTFGIGIGGAHLYFQRSQIAQSQRNQQFFEALGRAANRPQGPDAAAAFATELKKEGGPKSVYIGVDRWDALFQEAAPQAAAELFGDTAQYNEAKNLGADLVIPIELYASKLAGTKFHGELMQDLRLAAGYMSMREADTARDQAQLFLSGLSDEERSRLEAVGSAAPDEATRGIFKDVYGQLIATGMDTASAERNALMWMERYRARAERLNVDPAQLYAENPLTVRREMPSILITRPEIDITLDPMLDRLRRGEKATEKELFGQSLVEFLKEKGGLQDQGGELSAMDVDAEHKPFVRNLIQQQGLTLDHAAEIAQEAGFIPERDTNALLDAINKEVSGEPVYAAGSENERLMERERALTELHDYLTSIGADVAKMDNAEIRRRMVEATREGSEKVITQNADISAPPVAYYNFTGPALYQQDDLFPPEGAVPDADSVPAVIRRNVRSAVATRSLRTDDEVAGLYGVETALVAERTRVIPVSKIENQHYAARVFVSLSDYAVEHFDALVTDKNDKPLAIVGSFKGEPSSVFAYPNTMLAEAVRIKGAAKIWFAHNHPSGLARLSQADKNLNDNLTKVFSNTNIKPMGIFAIAGFGETRAFEWQDMEGRLTAGSIPIGQLESEKAAGMKQLKIPVIERIFIKATKIGQQINAPSTAKEVIPALAKEETGLVMVDTQLFPVGFFPFKAERLAGSARQKNALITEMLRAFSKAGATSAFLADPGHEFKGETLTTLGATFGVMGFRLEDTIGYLVKDGKVQDIRSAAERGLIGEPKAPYGERFALVAQHEWKTVDDARFDMADDRAHGDEALAAAANELYGVWKERQGDVEAYVQAVTARAAEIQRELGEPEGVYGQEEVRRELYQQSAEERVRQIAGFAAIEKFLTSQERSKLRTDTAQRIIDLMRELPTAGEMAQVAQAGRVKRGWYRNSAEALVNVFGPDATRFAALLAGLSPQQEVETNLENALNVWKTWAEKGRPSDPRIAPALGISGVPGLLMDKMIVNNRLISITRTLAMRMLRERGFPMESYETARQQVEIIGASVLGEKKEDSILLAWTGNSLRAFNSDDLEKLVLSGPKVNSFFKNLIGVTEEVTNDAWMANYALVDQQIFGGSLNVAGNEPGKGAGYLAMNVRVRQAAAMLTKMTGETWTPAEVQETVWSWAKSLYELASRAGEERTAVELLKAGELTDDLIASTPDFRLLSHEPRYQTILEQAGYREQVARLVAPPRHPEAAGAEALGPEGQAVAPAAAPRALFQAARRLDRLRNTREEERGRTLYQLPPATQQQHFREWFRDSKVVDDAGNPLVVYHGTNQDIRAFDKARGGAVTRNISAQMGIWFTDDPDVANEYAAAAGRMVVANVVQHEKDIAAAKAKVDSLERTARRTGDWSGYERAVEEWENLELGAIRKPEIEGQNVVPAYLSLINPLVFDFGGRGSSVGEISELVKKAKDDGNDGVIFKNLIDPSKPSTHYAVFDPSQIKSAITLLQAAQTPEPRGAYVPSLNLIKLLKKANPSTFLHESGHAWLEELRADAARADAPQQLRDDWRVISEWAGIVEGQEIPTEAHEKFARGIEAYVMEGKAPSIELREAFARFKDWLVRLYRNLRGLDVELTDEVRQVMDRMLATDDQIDRARQMAGYHKQLLGAEGMTAAEFADYQALNEAAKHRAEDDVRLRILRELTREREEWWKKERAAMVEDVGRQVDNEPVYRALSWLRTGKFADGTTLEGVERSRLSKAVLVDRYGQGFLKRLPRPVIYQVEGGIHPDVLAPLVGFETGDAMIKAIAESRPRKQLIEAEADARMRELHGDMMNDGSLADQADRAVQNDEQINVFQRELQILQRRGAGRRVTPLQAMRQMAVDMIGEKKLDDLNPRYYERAAMKAGQEAEDALVGREFAEGTGRNFGAAFDAKQRQMMNVFLYREAMKRKEAIEEQVKDWRQMFRPDDRLAKTRNMDMVNAARAIAAQYGMGRAAGLAATYMEQIRQYDPQTYDDLKETIDAATIGAKPWGQLTVNEFSLVSDAINGLWNLSRRSQQIEIDGKKMDRSIAVDELNERLGEFAKPDVKRGYTQAVTKWEKFKINLMSMRAALRRVEHWVSAMDGTETEGGRYHPFRTYIWQPISEAADRYREERKKVLLRYLELVKPIEKSITADKISAPEINYTFGASGSGRAELLGALLHTGNESSLQKFLRGRGWGDFLQDGTLDTSKWDAFIRRAWDEGILTKADYDFVQSVWDLFDSLKPAAQRAHREMLGYYFSEITAKEFNTPWGTYRGGYAPAIVDPFVSEDASLRADKEALERQGNSFMFPTTGRGFTMKRIEAYARPLAMDLRFVPQHIDKVLRFTYIEPHVKDVGRLVIDRRFREALGQIDSEVGPTMLVPWLQRSASQVVELPTQSRSWRWMDTFWREMRRRTGMQIMVANVTNTLQQFTGLPIAATIVKPHLLRGATWEYIRGPSEMADAIAEKSIFMRNRTTSQVMEIQQTIDNILLNPSAYEKARDFANRHGYFLQQGTQNIVDLITWRGAYTQATEAGLGEQDAIRAADSAVRETQGTFAAEDISGFEAGTPMLRAFTMFYSYFNMQANLLGTEFAKSMERGGFGGAARGLYVFTFGFLIPAIVSEALVQIMSGEAFNDDDDDGYLDNILSIFFGGPFRTAAAMVPFFGPAALVGVNAFNKKWYDDRISTSPAISMLEAMGRSPHSVYKAMFDDGSWKLAIKDALTVVGMLTGMPVLWLGRPLGYIAEIEQGKIPQPENPVEYTRGLISGRAGR